ncbi:MAG: murein biosynthesis integral membrane protein MurJ [Bacteroidetes bacterium]|nr:murein biosynthesis integral membrane protein MurJ [Bacteroidota bacterium]
MAKKIKRTSRSNSTNSLIFMICTIGSRLLGIIRVRLISTYFGASGIADVINFTFSIPNNLRKLLAEGALSSAFIPVLTKAVKHDEQNLYDNHAKGLIHRILTFQLFILLPITILVFLFPATIISFLSDFSDKNLITISAVLLKYFILYLITISITSVIQAVLQCKSIFVITALSPLLFSTSVIVSIVLLSDKYGAFSMGIGVLLGGLLQLIILIPAFFRNGYTINLNLQLHNHYFISVMKSFAPVVITSLMLIVTQQVSFYLASTLPIGGVTALSNSLVFWQMPYGVFYISIATVLFPSMSRSYHESDRSGQIRNLKKGIEYIIVFLLPSSLLLIFLSNELVFSILQRGKFTPENALRTANSLRYFTPGLIFAGIFNYNQRFFYSIHKFKLTIYTVIIFTVSDIVIIILCISFKLDIAALGIGNSSAYFIAVCVQTFFIKKEIPEIQLNDIAKYTLRILIANIPLAAGLLLYHYTKIYWFSDGSTLINFLTLLFIGLLSLIIIIFSYRLFHIDFLYKKNELTISKPTR